MLKFNTGTELRQNSKNSEKKNSENHIKLVRNSKIQAKNHAILHYVNGSAGEFLQMRTPAVQPPILCKKKFLIILYQWGYRKENI